MPPPPPPPSAEQSSALDALGEQMVKWRPGAAVKSAGVVEIFQEVETWGYLPKIYVKAFARVKKKSGIIVNKWDIDATLQRAACCSDCWLAFDFLSASHVGI